MGAFYTMLQGIGVTNLLQTFTHSLSITAALLIARITPRQVVVTATCAPQICVLGTNVVSAACGVGTLMTCDLEVQLVHSITQ